MSFFEGLDHKWWMDNMATIILTGFVVIQWVALQTLLIHYHFFRQNLKKPTPDGIRFQTIEKVLSFQAGQMDRLFGKLGELTKEIGTVAEQRSRPSMERAMGASSQGGEPSNLSFGEVALKKRLNEIRAAQSLTDTAAEIKSTKIN